MNKGTFSAIIRSFMPELLIGSACCAAGYFFIVDPLAKRLGTAQAEADRLSLAITQARPAPTRQDQERAEDAQRILGTIAERSRVATDQARLLQAISTLAEVCNVRIEQFNPASPRGPRATPGQTAAKPDAKVEQRSAFSVSITATYGNAARFVQSLQQDVGLTIIRNVRLLPVSTEQGDTVSVVIDTEHVWINPSAIERTGSNSGPPHASQPGSITGVTSEYRQ